MNESQRVQYLKAMGIEQWVLRDQAEPIEPNVEPSLEPSKSPESPIQPQSKPPVSEIPINVDWDGLEQTVKACAQCDLHNSRTQTVFGVGNRQADWMIIGEAPGADEDRQGEPFVGRAGQLLNEMLKAVGFAREQVYIANILKCRPPNNRDPQPSEVAQCQSYLKQQIEWVSPKIILAVGRISAQNLLQTDSAIGRLRGTVHRLPDQDVPVIVTYHPAYLLRKPSEKRKSWEDLKLAMRTVAG